MSYTNYSQNDSRWSGLHLGGSAWTMGQAGCFVTSMAVVATNLGHAVTPAQMLSLLEQHGLINGNGDITSPTALCTVFPDIQLISSNTWPTEKADLSVLGENTIIEIDDSPSPGMQTHFIPVIQVIGSDVQVMDVWDGVTRNVSAYGARWTPAVSAGAVIYGAWKYAVASAPKPVVNPNITLSQLTQLYQDLLHRAPDASGIDTFVGKHPYDFVQQSILNSAEYKADQVKEVPSEPTTPTQSPTEPDQTPVTPDEPTSTDTPSEPSDTPVATEPVDSTPEPPAKTPTPPKVIVPEPTYYRVWDLIVAILKKLFLRK